MRATPKSFFLLSALLACGCTSFLPGVGPSRRDIENTAPPPGLPAIQVVDVDQAVTQRLLELRSRRLFSETLGDHPNELQKVGSGDFLEVSIWEATPATLFGGGSLDARSMATGTRATTLPEQPVDGEGCITVPFAGRITAAGKTLPQIEEQITDRLKGKANQPEVLVRETRNLSSTVTVVGEVVNSTRVPLTPAHEKLLDALATAAGVRQPVNKTTIQVTRGDSVSALPLETIIRDPKQNVPLQAGDVITALFQPLSFTTLGATGKNEEVPFETQGITLAQALARSGGLIDQRSNPTGVFLFRFEPQNALDWPHKPVGTTPEGLVPVVYRVDLSDPRSFFVMQSFPMKDKDVLYVSNAPATELEKFLNILFTVAYPVIAAKQIGF
jgi:polysaccharide export outer membrane protein